MSISSVRERLNSARARASRVYWEAKSLMSSEMEGVVLKATRPDDLPVKPKHLEALLRPTAELPKAFNVYTPVVRKLWSKMAGREWRVSVKALYVVHRFASDGSSEHASNLKELMTVLRTHHDSRRKVNFFDLETICDVKAPSWSGENVAPFSEFLRAYAEFVLQRTTQFGPGFEELLDTFKMLVGEGEMLSAVADLVAAGSKCWYLREDQETPVTVAAAVQVAQDVRDVVEVCAAQLDYLTRECQARSGYPVEVDRWYAFLYENREAVEEMLSRTNELAARYKLVSLPPLVVVPLVLKLRDDEIEAENQAALEAEQQSCSAEKLRTALNDAGSPGCAVPTRDDEWSVGKAAEEPVRLFRDERTSRPPAAATTKEVSDVSTAAKAPAVAGAGAAGAAAAAPKRATGGGSITRRATGGGAGGMGQKAGLAGDDEGRPGGKPSPPSRIPGKPHAGTAVAATSAAAVATGGAPAKKRGGKKEGSPGVKVAPPSTRNVPTGAGTVRRTTVHRSPQPGAELGDVAKPPAEGAIKPHGGARSKEGGKKRTPRTAAGERVDGQSRGGGARVASGGRADEVRPLFSDTSGLGGEVTAGRKAARAAASSVSRRAEESRGSRSGGAVDRSSGERPPARRPGQRLQSSAPKKARRRTSGSSEKPREKGSE